MVNDSQITATKVIIKSSEVAYHILKSEPKKNH